MISTFFRHDTIFTIRRKQWILSAIYKQTLLLALAAAVLWWCFAVWLTLNTVPGTVWEDQRWTFLNVNLRQPYQTPGFVNPPWTVLFLLPLQPFSLGGGVMLQLIIFFVCLVGLIHRFGGKTPFWTMLIVVTSPLALDNAIELNIDWLVCLGLLVPPAYSAPLLLVKPQLALGYLLSFKWEDLIRWLMVLLITITLSLMIWGNWLPAWVRNITTILRLAVNMAPMSWAGTIPALVLCGLLMILAFRHAYQMQRQQDAPQPTEKHRLHPPDALLSILAGMCLVPYLATYSALLPLTLIAIRYPRLALVISLALWLTLLSILYNYGFFAPGGVRI